MSGKRPSLAESMKAVAEAPASPSAPSIQVPGTAAKPETEKAAIQSRPTKGFYAATRVGKKKATVALSEEAHKQLKHLAVDLGGVEALLTEAINDLFRKHGQQPIA
jgi:hypothetical protein